MLLARNYIYANNESLWCKAGLLHSDISVSNLMISEDNQGFLIDLDLAIKEQRDGIWGAQAKIGTRAFMAIGALYGEEHSFMSDLESFFWVLFWICIHCERPDKSRVVPNFEEWNYLPTETLAEIKKGMTYEEGDFLRIAEDYFTPYFKTLVPWVNRLRRTVFPNDRRWKKADLKLYSSKKILHNARNDPVC
ncbi:kinase-like domain-containing protein [Lineolata rhizophorae]|uniref:EKC/KEOPS complex subunit BUD32 n=1 Tax=Lineolata rhizophorae TaxID=578093 RepID=A0A6A6P120_9PEZI|nr:kinase-like domain-containing protein [Lineolata rhizophorae]